MFNWFGSVDELAVLSNILLNRPAEGNTSILHHGKAHSIYSYKIDNVVAKWYESVKRLVVQGSDGSAFRIRLMAALNNSSSCDLSKMDEIEVGTQNDRSVLVVRSSSGRDPVTCVESEYKCYCKRLKIKINQIQENIKTLQARLGDDMRISSCSTTSEDLHELKEENQKLRLELENTSPCIRELNNTVSELKMEKVSLLTTIRILQEDLHQQDSTTITTIHSGYSKKRDLDRNVRSQEDDLD